MNTESKHGKDISIQELKWNDLQLILAICRSGTLYGAANTLNLNHSTVFRKITAIENRLGVRFFKRMRKGYVMTESGETAMAYAERIESEFHALSREILRYDEKLQGKIYITAPEGIGITMLPDLLAEFTRNNPQVSIDLSLSRSEYNLTRREADIAIRATSKSPDENMGYRIGPFRFCIYASPGYMKRNPNVPDRADYRWIILQGTLEWLIPLIWKTRARADTSIALTTTSLPLALNAIRSGLGVSILPCHYGDQVEDIVRLSEPMSLQDLQLWVLTHPDLRHTTRVKTMLVYLYEALKEKRDLFAGNSV